MYTSGHPEKVSICPPRSKPGHPGQSIPGTPSHPEKPMTLTDCALAILREVFDGPLTAYPDSGHMKMPDWQFEEVIAVEDYLSYARGWRETGVQVIGGCCGLGVDHIAALGSLE